MQVNEYFGCENPQIPPLSVKELKDSVLQLVIAMLQLDL